MQSPSKSWLYISLLCGGLHHGNRELIFKEQSHQEPQDTVTKDEKSKEMWMVLILKGWQNQSRIKLYQTFCDGRRSEMAEGKRHETPKYWLPKWKKKRAKKHDCLSKIYDKCEALAVRVAHLHVRKKEEERVLFPNLTKKKCISKKLLQWK